MRSLKLLSTLAVLILTGCSAAAQSTPTLDGDVMLKAAASTASARLTEISAAITPTPSATPTAAPALPTVTPSPEPIPQPVAGVANNNVTVRSEARKGADNLGGVFFNQGVKVIARNDAATWYYIEWQKSPTGAAWVLASAIDLKGSDVTLLPIAIYNSAHKLIILPPLTWTVTGTPLPLNTPVAGARTASVSQLAKIRVGPGVGYSTMGTLEAGAVVVVTGRIDGNGWLQIEYPSGPDGRGWVSGDLLKMDGGVAGLPFYNLLATPISDPELNTEPPAAEGPASTPVPTLAGPPGVVIKASEINIRSGPASTYDALGSLKLDDRVVVTGLTLNRLWYQIVYPNGPGGHGWVASIYIQITGGDMTKLPYFNDLGTPLP